MNERDMRALELEDRQASREWHGLPDCCADCDGIGTYLVRNAGGVGVHAEECPRCTGSGDEPVAAFIEGLSEGVAP